MAKKSDDLAKQSRLLAKKSGDINININLQGLHAVPRIMTAAGVNVTITYPTSTDTPPTSFQATGTVWPANAALLGVVVVKSDPTSPANQYVGGLIQPGPNWIIEFCNIPASTPLVLYVFGSDGIYTGFASVEFMPA